MNGPIVVGVDGSSRSTAAVRWAAREAAARGAVLQPTNAWLRHARGARDIQTRGASAQGAELAGREAVELASVTARQIAPSLELRGVLVEGPAARRLVESAARASLLVVGTRGRGGFAALLLGSTSQWAAAHAACPVVVVADRPERPAASRVVLGVNAHSGVTPATRFAFEAAARAGAELHAVYGWAVDDSYERIASSGDFDPERLRARQETLLDEALAPVGAEFPQVKVVRSAVDATGDAALVAASQEADLVVISVRRPAAGPRHLGPIAHSVLRHAACPVAVVPQEA
jgi:nucleotide-binding universal stress UspA family protein